MIGYGANKGLIPIICNSIFEKINHNQDGTRSFEVKVSMLEIYNEAVKDLLSKSKKQDLKICEHKTLGVYVDGLEKFSVDSY
jgi:kinesin family protein 1